jgi:hypothetical protein
MRLKTFSYQRVIKLRDKLYNFAFRPYIDAVVSKDRIYYLHAALLAQLPATVSSGAVFESVRILAGKKLTQKLAAALAWRLAGNIDKLIAGTPVLPWTQQYTDERVPIRVEHVLPTKYRHVPGVIFRCRALAGSPCAMLFSQFVSERSCFAISKTLGFSAPWGPYPYTTPAHFVNLLLFAHIEAEKSRQAPFFVRVTASASMVAANRKLIAVRCRVQPCPFGFEHACEQCYFGYDQCDFATHDKTYITRHCEQCNGIGFFNPGSVDVVCVRCQQQQGEA